MVFGQSEEHCGRHQPSVARLVRLLRPRAIHQASTSNGVCGTGWCGVPEVADEASSDTRRTTCTTRSGSSAFREVAMTCRERRRDGTRESRVREIRTPGLTSGDWKRSHGANCDTGAGESCRKQPRKSGVLPPPRQSSTLPARPHGAPSLDWEVMLQAGQSKAIDLFTNFLSWT